MQFQNLILSHLMIYIFPKLLYSSLIVMLIYIYILQNMKMEDASILEEKKASKKLQRQQELQTT